MTLKSRILYNLLTKNGCLTAHELSEDTVSRNAVWKAVRSLQEEGYPIEAVAGKGYRLKEGTDIPLAHEISRLCGGAFNVRTLWECESTNNLLRRLAEEGASDGEVLIACRQNGGRGRMGRSFYSEQGGLYMSVLIRPEKASCRGGDITATAAVAVAKAIEKISGERADIKWVNDVFCHGKKVCGILTDGAVSVENGMLEYAVVGVGLNVYCPSGGFPTELQEIAGGVHGKAEAGLINRYAAEILNEFNALYTAPSAALEDYRSRCFLVGQTVVAVRGAEESTIKVLGISDDYNLIAEDEAGNIKQLYSGEVRVRPEGVPR
ncbi:MAG: biotin--[Clostridia bacterium]|nr:biotin--[acetyl-CoA-carboxylase] ligase [Clostridia bacterium]